MRKSSSHQIVPLETIQERIFVIRGVKVILDVDLAKLYGVPTKRLNEQVRRNRCKFPEDFMFHLTAQEVGDLRSQNATSDTGKNRSQIATGSQKHRDPRFLPYAFTEHGALQAANVLNSPKAISMSVYIIRAFVWLRQLLASHADLARKLNELEKKYDAQFKVVFNAIRKLMAEPEKPKRRIGFYGG